MRTLKILLIAVLIITAGLYGYIAFSGLFSNDSIPPVMTTDREVLEVSVKDSQAMLLTGLKATDKQDGDLTSDILIAGISKLMDDHTAKVTYVVFDRDDNMTTLVRPIRYTDYVSPRFSVSKPLIYYRNESITLLDRLHATDVIDGNVTDSIRVSSLTATSDPETYLVNCQVTNSMGDTAYLALPVIQLEGMSIRPEVILREYLLYISAGTAFDARGYLAGVNTPDGVGKIADVSISGTVDTSTPGTYMVRYTYPWDSTSATSILTVVVE